MTLVWLDDDLRLTDHPALRAAAREAEAVLPVYLDSRPTEKRTRGAAARWWRHHALKNLEARLEERGGPPELRGGEDPPEALLPHAQAVGADHVRWIRRYEPGARRRDDRVRKALRAEGISVTEHRSYLLHEPEEEIRTTSGTPYLVFTYFWKSFRQAIDPGPPLEAPDGLPAPEEVPRSASLDELELLPDRDWTEGLAAAWTPSESGAQRRIDELLSSTLAAYETDRDHLDRNGTSRLSPHLTHGTCSVRQIWHAVQKRVERQTETPVDPSDGKKTDLAPSAASFLRQVGWREFAYHVLVHHPETRRKPLKEKFRSFPWKENDDHLKAWQRGRTGYPVVDAAMHQLWRTGWMHNRARMIVASFLTKDLLQPWQAGEAWFWDTLVDADPANNVLGWQWAAGCGADAQPFFRIFNPLTQSRTFDPEGRYIAEYVPALTGIAPEARHAPRSDAPEAFDDLDYPEPIVDHARARDRALEAYETVR